MYNLSNICKAANTLANRGLTKSEAFKRAWSFAKNIIAKVAGTSFGKRPVALERLTRYSTKQISVQLVREDNPYDNSAICVFTTVEGKGSYCVGYLPSELSRVLAPIIDKGTAVKANLDKIVGGWFEGQKYGMRITVAI